MQLVIGSSIGVDSLSGHDAEALGYFGGLTHWAEYGGLDSVIRQQFEDDFNTLEQLSKDMHLSWVAMDSLSSMLETMSQENGFLRSVDPGFLSVLVNQNPALGQEVDAVLQKSAAVNTVLRRASQLDFVDAEAAIRGSTVLGSWIELLGQIRAKSNEDGND